jgi:hypothetical protein
MIHPHARSPKSRYNHFLNLSKQNFGKTKKIWNPHAQRILSVFIDKNNMSRAEVLVKGVEP